MRASFTTRIRLISLVVVVAALVLASRLYFVQVVRGETFSDKADRQYAQPQEGIFDRGSIFFEDKDANKLVAATLKSGYILTIRPKDVEDVKDTYEKINAVVEIDKEDFFFRAGKKDDPYEIISKKLSLKQADTVKKLDIPGVLLEKERWRYYPGNTTAARTLGFVAYKGDDLVGQYGLERYYDDVLKRDEETTYINFFADVFSNIGDTFRSEDKQGEGDLVLTIEPSVQAFLERELEKIMGEWNSKSAGGVVINPVTGEIYAMAFDPSFNLNAFSEVEDTGLFKNPIVESIFEMGSIIKPLTMSIGLDTKSVSARTTYYDKGFIERNTETIYNYDKKGRGLVDMQEVLNQSLNTGAAFIVSKIGNDTFGEYMRKFELGEETGIDLPGEVRGQLDNLKSPRDIEYATASFGQGIAMTPIATIRAMSALANGGRLITPHLVKRIDHKVGTHKNVFYNEGEQVIKPGTSEEITRMLVRVVDEALLGGTVKIDTHSIAAKTGTAQIADRVHGGYYDDRFFHSFFGYFPAYNPEFLVFLFTQEPVGARYASNTLTHPFMNITKLLISYYEVPPDR